MGAWEPPRCSLGHGARADTGKQGGEGSLYVEGIVLGPRRSIVGPVADGMG